MNVTMPYQTFRSQSRVEFIKKKFENSFPDEKDTAPLKRNSATVVCKANFMQELKDLHIDNRVVNLKSETNDVNTNEGKTSVKRSPAFRREKVSCTKSLTQVPFQRTSTFVELPQKNLNDNAQDSILNKGEISDVRIWKEFKRSKTDTNLLKNCSNRIVDKKNFFENSKNSEISNPLVGFSQNKDSKCNTETKTLDQYSVVNKKKNKPDKNEIVNLRFSESIRRALLSPLPKGPPPKKPPRTFCHATNFTKTNSLTTSTITPSPSSSSGGAAAATTTTATTTKPISNNKTDIPQVKSKLEKLEKVIRSHETGTFVNKTKNDFDKQVKKISMKVESRSTPDMTDMSQSCLPISSCLSQGTKTSNFKKVSKAKSEFYLAIDKADSNSSDRGKNHKSFLGSGSDEQQKKMSNPEAIYDLPCLNKKNSFGTFGKSNKDLKDSVNAKKAEGLHYMCTDVINQMPKYPNFMSRIDWRKNTEERSVPDILDLKLNFPSSEECNTSTRDDLKKFATDLQEEKEIQKLKTQSCAAGEESSGESESDSVTSDCNLEAKKKCDAEGECLSQVTAKRKIYVSRASSKLISQMPCWKYKNKNSYKHLFECCLLVGLTLCESKRSVPYIKSVFPPNTKPPPLIEALCFPDACYWPPTSENHHPEEQCYSLVVTNENGERKFGYCRRVLPEGGHICLPLAYCIISPHRAGGFFYKVLEELESRHGSPVVDNFIKQLYESEFPGPGERLKLKEILEEATKTRQVESEVYLASTLVRRPPDVRLEEKDLTQLFRHLQLPVFLKVFGSLLLERKILLLSNSLRNLSSCIEALQFILLPFSWQHTYIPVLPVHLIEMCEAPTPYIIGLLKPRNIEKSLTNVNFDDGILVDLDDSKILKCCGDEGSILPSRLTRDLKTSLSLAMSSSDFISESVRGVLISDVFIGFFVQVCGNYSKFIQNIPNGEKVFQKEEFIKSVTSNTTQSFLEWFTETAMFNSFIQDRLQGDDEDMLLKLFRRRAMEYSEDGVKDSAVLLKNYKVINKKVKTLGGKIKDFTSFTK